MTLSNKPASFCPEVDTQWTGSTELHRGLKKPRMDLTVKHKIVVYFKTMGIYLFIQDKLVVGTTSMTG